MSKKILVIVTGGVAIYKSLSLIRLLKKADYEVRCIMTKSATKLIQPILFASISGNPVRTEIFDEKTGHAIEHIGLSRWADLVVVVPATANIIGKMVSGIADDLASTTLMVSNKKILIAPAMNTSMWDSPAFQRNLKQIKLDEVEVIEGESGCLACGDIGKGRLAEPEVIFKKIEEILKNLNEK